MTEARSLIPAPLANRIGRFDLVREIGRGASGMIYEAVDRDSGTRVALKTLRSMTGDTVLQLKSEFRALQDIEHRNLIRLDELSCDGDRWFFTMELIDGEGFATYVTGHPPPDADAGSSVRPVAVGGAPGAAASFDEGRLRDGLAQLARGLEALHSVGKVHRDVKLENVLVTKDGRVVVIDLGLVREATSAPEEDIVGTVAYMAPEQIVGEAIDAACDRYAVGVILYVCLTGRYPYQGPIQEVLEHKQNEDPPPPSAVADGVPADLESLCMDLLRRDPAERPTGAELLGRLRRKASSLAPPARPVAGAPGHFVGRGAELDALVAAFRARGERGEGGGLSVLVKGESGIGKSALVTKFTQWVAESSPDALVLMGRCHEREAVPYKALDGVIDEVSRWLDVQAAAGGALPPGFGLLRQVFPVLERVDLLEPRASDVPALDLEAFGMREGRVRLFAALRALFAHLAAGRPLVLVIEDMQWADNDSLALLSALLRPPEAPPLMLVLTARAADGDAGTLVLPGQVRAITLGRLTPAEGVELARARLAECGVIDERLAQAIADEAAGHPLFLDELAQHAQSARGLAAARVSLDDVFGARIDHLDPGPRRLLEVLSVAGIPLRPSAVVRAADVSSAEYAALVRTLRIGHLARTVARDGVDALEVYHDRVRDAVCHRLDEDARRAHHERVARALEAGAKPDEDALATHWLAAGDRARALHYTSLAADGAYRALAFDRAAQLYEAALALADGGVPMEDDARQLARTRLAEAYASLGRMPEAARAFEAAARHATTKAGALDLRRREAESFLNGGAFEQGEAVMDEVLAAVGLRPDRSRLAALVGFLLGRLRLWWRGIAFRERDEASIPARELTRLDACWGISSLLGPLDVIRSSDFQTKTLLFALDAGEPARIVRALAVDAPIRAARGPSTRARTEETLAQAASIASRLRSPQLDALVLVSRGFTEFLQGDFRGAYASTVAGLTVLRDSARHAFFEIRTGDMVILWTLSWFGELRELARRLAPFLAAADARGDLYAATTMRIGPPSIAALRDDDPESARAGMRAASARWVQRGYHTPHYWSMYAEAQVDLYEGRGHAAWTRIAENWPKMRRSLMLNAQVIRLEATFLRARAALATAVEHPEREGAMLSAAARDARTLGGADAPYAKPLAGLVKGSIDAMGGRTGEARAHLREALAGFEGLGMRLHAEATRWRLGQLAGDAEGAALVATAEAWARGEGIVSPRRMFAMIAPGFAVRGPPLLAGGRAAVSRLKHPPR